MLNAARYFEDFSIASLYDNLDLESDLEPQRDLFNLSKNYLNGNPLVLDLMAGSGFSSLPFKEMGLENIVLLDNSEELLRLAKQKNFKNLLKTNVASSNLPFKENSFDMILSSHSIFYLSENILGKKVIPELSRIMKNGAYFIFNDLFDNKDETIKLGNEEIFKGTGDYIPITYKHDFEKLKKVFEENKLRILKKETLRLVQNLDETYKYGTGLIVQKLIKA